MMQGVRPEVRKTLAKRVHRQSFKKKKVDRHYQKRKSQGRGDVKNYFFTGDLILAEKISADNSGQQHQQGRQAEIDLDQRENNGAKKAQIEEYRFGLPEILKGQVS